MNARRRLLRSKAPLRHVLAGRQIAKSETVASRLREISNDETAFFSAHCCWWTTNPSDVGEAPRRDASDIGRGLPACPFCYSPLFEAPAKDFVYKSIEDPSHFGARGLETFLAAYGAPCHRQWTDYEEKPR